MTKLRPALAAVLMLIVPCAWTYEPPEADWNAIGLNAEKQSATYWLQRSPEVDKLLLQAATIQDGNRRLLAWHGRLEHMAESCSSCRHSTTHRSPV